MHLSCAPAVDEPGAVKVLWIAAAVVCIAPVSDDGVVGDSQWPGAGCTKMNFSTTKQILQLLNATVYQITCVAQTFPVVGDAGISGSGAAI